MTLSRWIQLIGNYAIFYGIWFLAIWSASHHLSWVALICTGIYIIVHLIYWSPAAMREASFIALLTCIGIASDCLLANLGMLIYHEALLPGITLWTLSLWLCFATTYWHSFIWLEGRPVLALILGAIVAPICYNSLIYTGVIEWVAEPNVAKLWVGAIWALLLPSSFIMSKYLRTGTNVCS